MTRRAGGPLLALVAGGVLVASACDTTYDTSATTESAVTTTAYVAAATSAEALDVLVTEVRGLSERLVDNDGQRDALARIEAQWAVARPDIEADRPDLLAAFDDAIALVQRAVERRRPADADKASKNLTTLIAAYQT